MGLGHFCGVNFYDLKLNNFNMKAFAFLVVFGLSVVVASANPTSSNDERVAKINAPVKMKMYTKVNAVHNTAEIRKYNNNVKTIQWVEKNESVSNPVARKSSVVRSFRLGNQDVQAANTPSKKPFGPTKARR